MVLDSSVIVALLLNEPETALFLNLIEQADVVCVAAPTILECEIVIGSALGAEGLLRLDELLVTLDAKIVPFGARELAIARTAFRTFGKGRHPAALNYGDCFSYAAAVAMGDPLLFKGADFAKTDVPRVIVPARHSKNPGCQC